MFWLCPPLLYRSPPPHTHTQAETKIHPHQNHRGTGRRDGFTYKLRKCCGSLRDEDQLGLRRGRASPARSSLDEPRWPASKMLTPPFGEGRRGSSINGIGFCTIGTHGPLTGLRRSFGMNPFISPNVRRLDASLELKGGGRYSPLISL